jgi:ribosome maturation factor RimP
MHGKTTNVRKGSTSGSPAGRTRAPGRQARPERPPVRLGPGPGAVGWREAITATVGGLGYELVDVERAMRGLLRVTIDRIPGRAYAQPGDAVTVEDCEQVTRQLQYAPEVEGLDYARLEVSSPGLDRPLKSEADFQRFAGQRVHITLKVPFEGRKVWQGLLGAAEGGGWSLVFKEGKAPEQVLGFKFEEVREARLVPVVDFKGRKSQDAVPAVEAPVAAEDAAAAPAVDGGEESR